MRVVDARQTFLGIWIRQLIEGSAIKVFGDGLQLRDFNFVDDCVDALLLAATNEAAIGQVYNLGSREVVNLKSLAELMIQMVAGGRFEIVPFHADRKSIDIGDYYRSEEHTSELQSLMRISYAVFYLIKKQNHTK